MRALMRQPWSDCIRWDRVFMVEAALATGFYSAAPTLFFKNKNAVSIKMRHKNDPEQRRHYKLFAYHHYLGAILWRVARSKAIPLSRKSLILPLWLQLVWRERKRIIGITLRDVRRLFGRGHS